MKGDEKHRLEENELQRLALKAKPFMDQYGNTVLISVSATVLIVAIGVYIMRDQASGKSKGWDPLGSSILTSGASTAKLETLGEQQADTVPGLIAKVQAAQRRINQGMQFSFSNTAKAQDELKAARDLLEEALGSEEPVLPPVIKAQATFALAQCLESTWDGNPDSKTSPIKAYDAFIKEYGESSAYPEIGPYVDIAKERVDRLKSEHTQEFYAWFHEQNLTPTKVADMRAALAAANIPPTSPHNTGLPPGHPEVKPHVPSEFDKWSDPDLIREVMVPAPGFELPGEGDVAPDGGTREVKPIPDSSEPGDAPKPDETDSKPKPPVNPIPDGDTPDKGDTDSTTPDSAASTPSPDAASSESNEKSDAPDAASSKSSEASSPKATDSKDSGSEDKPAEEADSAEAKTEAP